MCVDVCAPGHAITIPFLHEQIWFGVEYARLSVTRYCDCLVKNDSDHAIEQLRLHFSEYVPLEKILVQSGTSDPTKCRSSWYCTFQSTDGYDNSDSRVTVNLRFERPDDESYGGRILKGSFQPSVVRDGEAEGLIPVASVKAEDFMQDMRQLDCQVLDLHLDLPLTPGDTGWIRLKMEPNSPGDLSARASTVSPVVPLPSSPLLDAPHQFVARRTVLCPVLLRDKVRRAVQQKPFDQWSPEILVHGLDKAGTLTRIEDHRVTVILPQEVQISGICSSPHETTVPVAPVPLDGNPDQYALHVLTGSRQNENRDVVGMACRVLNYLRTVYKEGATEEHLVNRFGADQQEAIGLLLKAMIRTGVLTRCSGQPALAGGLRQETYRAVTKEQESRRLVDLRAQYARLVSSEPSAHYLSRIRELHPFRLSFSLAWTKYSDIQIRQLGRLKQFIKSVEEQKHLEPIPRHAVVVVGSEYDDLYSPSELAAVGERLVAGLRSSGQFAVDLVHNPESAEAIVGRIRRKLDSVGRQGVFLFWFVGHAVPYGAEKELLLLHKQSTIDVGLRISDVMIAFQKHPNVLKVAVLDCCHAELAVDQRLPANTMIWPTAGKNQSAPPPQKGCGIIAEEDAAGRRTVNFTSRAAEILLDGDQEVQEPVIDVNTLLVRASEYSPTQYEYTKKASPDTLFEIAVNRARQNDLLQEVFAKMLCHEE